jgi:hypothetical protein
MNTSISYLGNGEIKKDILSPSQSIRNYSIGFWKILVFFKKHRTNSCGCPFL